MHTRNAVYLPLLANVLVLLREKFCKNHIHEVVYIL